MQTTMRKCLIPVAVAVGSLLIGSCPLPVTKTLVEAVEDDKAPFIVVTSHNNNDYFYSSLIVEGTISDDAISPGDGEGRLHKLSFFAEAGYLYNGGIIIDSQGNITADPSLGGGTLIYDASSGHFSIEIDTLELDSDLFIRITAEDIKGNTGKSDLTLLRSNGPMVSILEPTDPTYTVRDSIILSGTLSDSFSRTETIDEIDEVSLSISTLSPVVTMDIGSGESSPHYVSPGVFAMSIPQIPGTSSDEALFQLRGTAFTCSFYPPDSGMGSPRITVSAVDKNGNVGADSIDLTLLTGGPIINIYEPGRGVHYFSSNSSNRTSKDHLINFRSKVSSGASPVKRVTIQTKDANDTDFRDPIYDYNAGDEGYEGPMDHDVFIDLRGNDTGQRAHVGDVRILITAIDISNKERLVTRNIADVPVGPQFDDFTFVSSVGNAQYAKSGETVTMNFSLSNAIPNVDVDYDTLMISDTGNDAGYNAILSNAGEGPYTLSFNLDASTPVDSEKRVTYTLRVEDKVVGNLSIMNQEDLSLYLYPSPPTSAPTVTFNKTVDLSVSNYLRGSEGIRGEFNPGRHLNLEASKFRFVLNGSPTSDITLAETSLGSGVYEAVYGVGNSDADGPVGWELDYVDMAGNSADFDNLLTDFTVDNTSPKLNNESIVSNYINNGVVPKDSKGVVEFEIDETGSGISSAEVQFYVDNAPIYEVPKTATSQGNGIWKAETDSVDDDFPEGSLTASISVTDNAGNNQTSDISGSSVLVDNAAPQFGADPTVSSSGVISGSTDEAGIGDTITVNIVLDDPQKTNVLPVVRLAIYDNGVPGTGVTLNPTDDSVPGSEGTAWTATYTVGDSLTTTPLDGIVTVEVDTQDDYGQTANLSVESGVTIDNIAPVISEESLKSNNPNDVSVALGGENSGIVNFEIDETGSGIGTAEVEFSIECFDPIDNFDPVTVTASYNQGGGFWEASITIDDTLPEGTLRASIKVTDNMGNTSQSDVNSGVTVDHQAPQFRSNPTVSSSGNTSGSTDEAGIGDTITVDIVLDDPQMSGGPPVVRLAVPNGNTVTLNPTDDSVPGSEGTAWTANYTVGAPLTTTPLDGIVTVEVDTQDDYGQTANLSFVSGVTVDNIVPVISGDSLRSNNPNDVSVALGGTNSGIVEFMLSESDSIVAKVYFSINGSLKSTVDAVAADDDGDGVVDVDDQGRSSWSASFLIDNSFSEGALTALIEVTDKGGNNQTSDISGSSVLVDHQAPQFSSNPIVSSNGNTSGSADKAGIGDTITVNIVLDDPQTTGGPPVVRLAVPNGNTVTLNPTDVSVPGSEGTAWTANYTVGAPLTTTPLDGIVTVEVDTQDDYGQTANLSFVSGVTVDNIVPVISGESLKSDNTATADVSVALGGTNSGIVEFMLSESDSIVAKVYFSINGSLKSTVDAVDQGGGSWSASFLIDNSFSEGALTALIEVTDKGGNIRQGTSLSGVTVDHQAPQFSSNPIVSSNGNTIGGTSGSADKAGIGDTITVNIVLDDPQTTGGPPVVRLAVPNGNTVTFNPTDVSATESDRTAWTATYIVGAPLTTTPLDGIVTVEVDTQDDYGQTANLSFVSGVTVDNIVPSPSTPQILSVGPYSNGDTVTVTLAPDSDTYSSVVFRINSVDYTANWDVTNLDWRADVPLATGSHDLTATVTDDHGNSAISPSPLTVTVN